MADSVIKNELSPIQDIISSPAPINPDQSTSAPALNSPSSTTVSAATTTVSAPTTEPPTPSPTPATPATPAPASATRPQAHAKPFSSTSITRKFLQKSQQSPSSTNSSSAAQTATGSNGSAPAATGSVANGPSKSTSRACASAYLPDSLLLPNFSLFVL